MASPSASGVAVVTLTLQTTIPPTGSVLRSTFASTLPSTMKSVTRSISAHSIATSPTPIGAAYTSGPHQIVAAHPNHSNGWLAVLAFLLIIFLLFVLVFGAVMLRKGYRLAKNNDPDIPSELKSRSAERARFPTPPQPGEPKYKKKLFRYYFQVTLNYPGVLLYCGIQRFRVTKTGRKFLEKWYQGRAAAKDKFGHWYPGMHAEELDEENHWSSGRLQHPLDGPSRFRQFNHPFMGDDEAGPSRRPGTPGTTMTAWPGAGLTMPRALNIQKMVPTEDTRFQQPGTPNSAMTAWPGFDTDYAPVKHRTAAPFDDVPFDGPALPSQTSRNDWYPDWMPQQNVPQGRRVRPVSSIYSRPVDGFASSPPPPMPPLPQQKSKRRPAPIKTDLPRPMLPTLAKDDVPYPPQGLARSTNSPNNTSSRASCEDWVGKLPKRPQHFDRITETSPRKLDQMYRKRRQSLDGLDVDNLHALQKHLRDQQAQNPAFSKDDHKYLVEVEAAHDRELRRLQDEYLRDKERKRVVRRGEIEGTSRDDESRESDWPVHQNPARPYDPLDSFRPVNNPRHDSGHAPDTQFGASRHQQN